MNSEIKQLFKNSNLLNGLATSILVVGVLISLIRLDNQYTNKDFVTLKKDNNIRNS